MNTILVTGTAKTITFKTRTCTSFKVEYNVYIWAAKEGEQISLLTTLTSVLCGYGELWETAKAKAEQYHSEPRFLDGAYTQFIDHLIMI